MRRASSGLRFAALWGTVALGAACVEAVDPYIDAGPRDAGGLDLGVLDASGLDLGLDGGVITSSITSTCTAAPWAGASVTYWFEADAVEFSAREVPNAAAVSGFRLVAESDGVVDGSLLPEWLLVHPDPSGLGLHGSLEVALRDPALTVGLLLRPGVTGRLLSLSPFDFDNQALNLVAEPDGRLCGVFSSSPSDAHEACLTPDPAEGAWVVLLSLDPQASSPVRLVVNGDEAPASARGTPGLPGTVDRTLFVGPDIDGPLGLGGLHLYRSALGDADLQALGLRLAEGRAAFDGPAFDGVSGCGGEGGPARPAALALVDARCGSCHTGIHAGWTGQPRAWFVERGLVIEGDALASPLYYRLTGSAGDGGPKNMPASRTLSPEDAQLLRDWIDAP